ncbi:hypothetical protein NQ317_014302 [Molorchus minor]|uniref:Charged multivesicular body protein 7 n=1 Tax=Molorchus minor TaxID=1323400 RepID=A0ABQ9JYQ8_9CUCU|nr:hypothetical protein NQ317_014302 [Molorchus minor]
MFQIPEDKLPNSLKDEQRINVLFAPLRNQSVNAKDWENKISAWKNILKIYCESNDVYSFTLTSLNKIFVRNGRPPSCFNEVISEMIKTGELQVIDVFLKKSSDTWSGWAADVFIKRPLSWSFNKIKNSIFMFTNNDKDNTFVYLEVIKLKCDNLLISLNHLLSLLGKNCEHIDNIKLVLHYLLIQHKIDIMKLNSKGNDELETFLIKFGDGSKVTLISEKDIGIYTLERNEGLISKNIESLEDEIQNCVKDAKLHLSKNHRQMAKSSLRKKHELEKKANALHNIQILLEQIHETHTDAHVWEAYKNALSAFDTTFKDTGMSEDVIEDTMIKLGDMLDRHEDIQTALARPMDTNDSDLEEELAELLRNDTGDVPPDDSGFTNDLEKHMEKLSLELPDVPSKSPDVSVQEASLQICATNK